MRSRDRKPQDAVPLPECFCAILTSVCPGSACLPALLCCSAHQTVLLPLKSLFSTSCHVSACQAGVGQSRIYAEQDVAMILLLPGRPCTQEYLHVVLV